MKLSDFRPDDLAKVGLLVLTTGGSAPAFAEEPAPTAPVAATTTATAVQAKTIAFEGDAGLGLCLKTLDSGTADVQDGALCGAVKVSGGIRPIPGFQLFSFGPELSGRFSSKGAGLSAVELEFGLDSQRWAVDVGAGGYWDVTDGVYGTNVDDSWRVSVDGSVDILPEDSKLLPWLPSSVGLSVAHNFLREDYVHPAFMNAEIFFVWRGVKPVELPQRVARPEDSERPNEPVAVVETPKDALPVVAVSTPPEGNLDPSTAVVQQTVEQPKMSIPELPELTDLEGLPDLVKGQKLELENMVQEFFATDPGLNAIGEDYLTEGAVEFTNPSYYEKKMSEKGAVSYEKMSDLEVSDLLPEAKAKFYLESWVFQVSYVTGDGISDLIQVVENFPKPEDSLAFVAALDAYVLNAKAAGYSVDPAVLSECVLLNRMIVHLKPVLEAHRDLNKLRVQSYKVAKADKAAALANRNAARDGVCAEVPACTVQAEVARLSGELEINLASDKSASAGFRTYLKLIEELENGGVLSVDDYQNGYLAALNVGRIDMALEAAEQVLRRRYSPEAVNQLAALKENYGLISIKHSGGGLINLFWEPVTKAAVNYANTQLEENKKFEGYLPVGTYTFSDGTTFEVKPGETNDRVR